jgi:hypothetical protein
MQHLRQLPAGRRSGHPRRRGYGPGHNRVHLYRRLRFEPRTVGVARAPARRYRRDGAWSRIPIIELRKRVIEVDLVRLVGNDLLNHSQKTIRCLARNSPEGPTVLLLLGIRGRRGRSRVPGIGEVGRQLIDPGTSPDLAEHGAAGQGRHDAGKAVHPIGTDGDSLPGLGQNVSRRPPTTAAASRNRCQSLRIRIIPGTNSQ